MRSARSYGAATTTSSSAAHWTALRKILTRSSTYELPQQHAEWLGWLAPPLFRAEFIKDVRIPRTLELQAIEKLEFLFELGLEPCLVEVKQVKLIGGNKVRSFGLELWRAGVRPDPQQDMAVWAKYPDHLGERALERQAVIEGGGGYHCRERAIRLWEILGKAADQLEIGRFLHRQGF